MIETYSEMQAREKQERIEKSKDRQSASLKSIQNESAASVLFYCYYSIIHSLQLLIHLQLLLDQ